jgi:hypothetical protein
MGAAGLPVRRRPEIGGHPGQAIPVQILAGGIGWSSLGARSSEMGRGPAVRRAGRPVPRPRVTVAKPKLGKPYAPPLAGPIPAPPAWTRYWAGPLTWQLGFFFRWFFFWFYVLLFSSGYSFPFLFSFFLFKKF